MRVLVTGAAGFVGRYVVQSLVQRTWCDEVIVLRSRSVHEDGSHSRGELDLETALNQVSEGLVSVVINLAVEYGYDAALESVVGSNLVLPAKILRSIGRNAGTVFVNCDSYVVSTAGKYDKLPDYMLSKLALRHWLNEASSSFPVANVVLEHVYGPGDRFQKFLPWLCRELLSGRQQQIPLTLGNQIRDFIFVTDAAEAIVSVAEHMLFAERKSVSEGMWSVDVGTGIGMTVREMVIQLHRETRSQASLAFGLVPASEYEMNSSVAPVEPLQALGWHPQVSLEKGVRLLVADIRHRLSRNQVAE